MTDKNYLAEIKKIANKRKKENQKKKNLIRVINIFLVALLIVCLYIFADAIKPTIIEYVNYLSSPLVCIDPGHGGSQTGATYNGRLEKDDNLNLALLVRDILKEKGIRVTLTRDKDETVSLIDRAKYANKKDASLYVSLHRNYASNKDAKGIEIWAGKDKTEEETILANSILNELKKSNYTNDRGVRYGSENNSNSDYYVILKTEMPSVIVETGFVSNEEDNYLYDENIEDYAQRIADGIIEALIKIYPDEMIDEVIKFKE